jgi:hypothetical protein
MSRAVKAFILTLDISNDEGYRAKALKIKKILVVRLLKPQNLVWAH